MGLHPSSWTDSLPSYSAVGGEYMPLAPTFVDCSAVGGVKGPVGFSYLPGLPAVDIGILFKMIARLRKRGKPVQIKYCSILAFRVFSSIWIAEDLMI